MIVIVIVIEIVIVAGTEAGEKACSMKHEYGASVPCWFGLFCYCECGVGKGRGGGGW